MKPLAWSHSSLENFKNCPKQYYHLKVVKDVKDSPNEAALWGIRAHEGFEAHFKAQVPLPESLAEYKGYIESIKDIPGKLLAEQQLALSRDMTPCDWFDKTVWVRGIVDVLVIDGDKAYVLDHKFGRNRKPSSRQLMLFALLVFEHYPEVKKCKTSFAWLAHMNNPKGYIDSEVFYREQMETMWQEFLPDLNMFSNAFRTEIFVPRQSGLCNGWCPVKHCEYWKPKK